jgi:F1F0 ATPase subunit 2
MQEDGMVEFMSLAVAMAAGLMLGVFFFGGLWWTIVRGLSSPRPALWFMGGLLLRMSVTLAGFYFVGHDNWRLWLACLLGFVLARLAAHGLSGSLAKRPAQTGPGGPSCA